MTRRRRAAVVAVLAAVATAGLAVVVATRQFPLGLAVLGCVALSLAAAWYGVLRRGVARVGGLAVAALGLGGASILLLTGGGLGYLLLIAVGVLVWPRSAQAAFSAHVVLPRVPPPRRPVLFLNPRSGGGKAKRFSLAEEARARGIEPVELHPDDDLESLVRGAVARGADAVAMAGGDGSQAIVAAVAAELGLPYACIPAGTRNHFALDLGVDRDDVVGALDAFVDGGERWVDLGEVNGRVFVNNVSLGLYAKAVERPGYREAKLRTLLDTVPDVLGPGGDGLDLRWMGPGGHEHHEGAAVLVSNNRYRLGTAVGAGTRPSIDDGLLGITVVSGPTGGGARGRRPQWPWREWSTSEFEVESDRPVPAGVDGEALVFDPPVRFRILPRALQARISKNHPGASPSALEPENVWDGLRALLRTAAGRENGPHPATEPGR